MLKGFDHVNVRTGNLAAMIAWYDDVLGLSAGWRPNFPFDGAWLYMGDKPVVHLVEEQSPPDTQDPRIEHFAFSATGFPAFIEKLKGKGVEFALAEVKDAKIMQVNVFDPDQNHIHIDFAIDEVPPTA